MMPVGRKGGEEEGVGEGGRRERGRKREKGRREERTPISPGYKCTKYKVKSVICIVV